MSPGGGWLESDGPSPELEARWGPDAQRSRRFAPAAAPPAGPPSDAPPGDAWVPTVLAPDGARRLRVPRAIAVVAAVVVVVAGAMTSFLALRDGGDDTTVTAAAGDSSDSRDGSVGSDERSAAELSDSAQAFLDRWNAGPSTTMPLGAAGVPPEERAPTTTVASATARSVANARTTSSPSSSGSVDHADDADDADRFESDEDSQRQPPTLAADDPRLRDAEHRAQEFVDAMTRRDCDAFWSMLSQRTIEFFEEMDEDDETSAKDSMCESLAEEEIPVITVRPPARPYGKDGALVTLEAQGEPEAEELGLVIEGDRWMVDLFLAYE